MSTNHQTKENVLNQIKEIENNSKMSINTEKNLRETRAIAAIKNNPKYFYKFVNYKYSYDFSASTNPRIPLYFQ